MNSYKGTYHIEVEANGVVVSGTYSAECRNELNHIIYDRLNDIMSYTERKVIVDRIVIEKEKR